MNLIAQTSKPPAPPAIDLAFEANEAHESCCRSGIDALQQALKAGDMLLRAKALVPHGEWKFWLEGNFHGSRRTAQFYMRLTRNRGLIEETSKAQGSALLTIDSAARLIGADWRAGLPPEDAAELEKLGEEIWHENKETTQAILNMGKLLCDSHAALAKDGATARFKEWTDHLGISDARRYMRAWRRFDLTLDGEGCFSEEALWLLADPKKASESAARAAADRVREGERIGIDEAREIIAESPSGDVRSGDHEH